MKLSRWITALVVVLGTVGSSNVVAQQKELATFGGLEIASAETAQAQSLAWLKQAGKTDAATLQQFNAIWQQSERTVLDRVAETLALGNAEAGKLLREARDLHAPAPTSVPAIFKDGQQSEFFRANLALAYARLLSHRRVHEEALETLKLFRPEQVVDPATYLFHRAVCEHSLLLKEEARKTINRLLDEVVTPPERYKTVSALMLLDMQTWKEKDLAAVARKMEMSERRLDLARGGPQTQKIQKEIVARLDELIKELENKAKKKQQQGGGGGGGDQECPEGGQPQPGNQPGGSNNPTAPMPDSQIANQGGSGKVDQAQLRKLAEGWGRMPERERARALQELTRGLSASHREAIENYFRNLAQAQNRR